MTPIWIFPCYPLLVIGPHAGALAEALQHHRPLSALSIIVGGFVFQGIGFLLSLMIYAAFIYRLMTEKLPEENLRPGMFVSVGPSGTYLRIKSDMLAWWKSCKSCAGFVKYSKHC
jgi:tellurite resistance protein TehA-like permease